MSLAFDLVPNTRRTSPKRLEEILANPGFVKYFSDHMAIATWTEQDGWHDSKIQNYQSFEMLPGSGILHYAQEIFEGMKAYRHQDGSIWLFRPKMNAQRLNFSASRLVMPQLPEEDFMTSVFALMRADQDWVPQPDAAFYLRPFIFADQEFLGVKSASRFTYAVIGGPAGSYLGDGVTPVDIWVTTNFARVGNDGTGAVKCGGNYAASLSALREGTAHDCSQVLFTDASTHQWVEELGGMNFFIVTRDNELITPPTTGTILAGITRDSILTIAPSLGLTPIARPISLEQMLAGITDGEITEAFACGTAVVITPIGALVQDINGSLVKTELSSPPGEATMALRRAIVDIQFGRADDRFSWMQKVVP